jgi:WD40 repeat protein
MNRLSRLLTLTLLVAALAACASPTAPAATALKETQPAIAPQPTTGSPPQESASAWPSELFFARPEGAQGALIAYDMADGSERFRLPAGLLSADGKRYFALGADGTQTALKIFDPHTGHEQNSWVTDGAWALSGLSPNGRWAALTRLVGEDQKQKWTAANKWETEVQIVDAQSGRSAHRISFEGNFEVETVSNAGDSLFLIQYLPAVNPDHYQIRLYDLAAETLQPNPLVDKRESDEVMAGQAWDAVATPDGRWLLTLYLRPQHGTAFIHALSLQDKFTFCIDLPSGGSLSELKFDALTLGPDGQTLYVANAVTGRVAVVNLNDLSATQTAEFKAHASPSADPQTQISRSVISQDGRTVFFTSGQGIWAYDTYSQKVNGPYLTDGQITGLGLSSDGKRLYVASTGQPLMVFDAASGRTLSFQPSNPSGQ